MEDNVQKKRLKQRVTEFWEEGVRFFGGISSRHLWTFAAASTFYIFLSLFPIITLLCTLLPFTPLTETMLLDLCANTLPYSIYTLVADIVADVYASNAAVLSIAAVVTVWSSSLAMMSIMRGLDAAYGRRRRMNYVITRLLASFIMIVFLAMLLVTLCVIVYGSDILNMIESQIPETFWTDFLLILVRYGRYLVMILFLSLLFTIAYKYLAIGKRAFANQIYGAIFTTVAWLLFSSVYSAYVSLSNRYGVYGLLGTVVVAMLWVYYCMFFFLMGGYINHYIEQKRSKSE